MKARPRRRRPGPAPPPSYRAAALLLVGALSWPACGEAPARDAPVRDAASRATPAPPAPVAGSAGSTRAPAIPDSVFVRLVADLSEPDRYFDTDNLISNESSYLHVIDGLEERGIRGGVFLGVGPGQNFSYMAATRPTLAFMIDIRRDNLLQHLWYKALFEAADSRLEYLCLLVARACGEPSDSMESATLSVEGLVARVDAAEPVDTAAALIGHVVDRVVAIGVPLSPENRAFVRSIHERFAADGLDLRFNTHGRPPQAYYPTFRRLLLERDRSGRPASYLATEAGFREITALQRANRVVPVVGDLAGQHALEAVGREIDRRGLRLTAFYVSNVEYYLFGDGTFPRFIDNLHTLPIRDDAVMIRSYFHRFRPLPTSVPGSASTQLLHAIPALLREWEEGRIRGYRDLVALSEE